MKNAIWVKWNESAPAGFVKTGVYNESTDSYLCDPANDRPLDVRETGRVVEFVIPSRNLSVFQRELARAEGRL